MGISFHITFSINVVIFSHTLQQTISKKFVEKKFEI